MISSLAARLSTDYLLSLGKSSVVKVQTSPTWSVNIGEFPDTMTLSAVVTIGGATQASGTLGAFVGAQVRGVQSTPSVPTFGPYASTSIYQLTIYASSIGEALSFLFHDGSSTTTLVETLSFAVNAIEGSATSPFSLSGIAAQTAYIYIRWRGSSKDRVGSSK